MAKQYNHLISEPEIQKFWQENETYRVDTSATPRFTIDTPPPTVSGKLHIGHIFSYTQTDIIARFKRMSGFAVFYPFGFDDNGLPTERYVEKKRDVRAHTMKRQEFIALCLEESTQAAQTFKALWQKVGLSVDWNYCYSTISDHARHLSQLSFIELYQKGFIYRKQEPALYCTLCHTSVAQAELDDKTVPSFFNDIVFTDFRGQELLIGTTRPELLPSCVALFYHPNDSRYTYLAGTTARVPLYDFQVPVIADEKVDPTKGTGLVMCCTFGDSTDVHWFKKHSLTYKQSIGFDGKFTEQSGPIAGLSVSQARTKIIELLRAQSLLRNQKEISHSVHTHERCKKEIEFVVLNQWFIDILSHKEKFIALADQIEWYPAFMKSRYVNWVTNINWDWCISRQRFFGVTFPVWHCAHCQAILLAEKTALPVDPQETKAPRNCTQCGSDNLVGDTDVMDTWNTSSITPYLCASLFAGKTKIDPEFFKNQPFIPMSMRPQAHDIIRTWAFDTIVKAWMHEQKIPWQTIVISGHVLSEQKEKISKSKENAFMDPEQLLAQYPADAVRYWTASGTLGHDTAFSENQIKIGMRLITKLWNAFRFIGEHIGDAKIEINQIQIAHPINQSLLHQLNITFANYRNYFEQNEGSLALDAIDRFFWHDFCDNYLELMKHQLFNSDEEQSALDETRTVLRHVGLAILQLYAPYMPHITEAIYQEIFGNNNQSLHKTTFICAQKEHQFPASLPLASLILSLVAQVRKLKTEKQLSLKTPVATLTIAIADLELLTEIKKQSDLIRRVSQATTVEYRQEDQKESIVQLDELWYVTINGNR